MRDTDWPAEDLRARLAAEATLAQKQTELATANTKIAAHAKQLTDEIIVKRQEAESLRGENLEVRSHLEKAESAMRLAERRLWDSLEAIEDGFAVFDGDNRLIAANRAYLAPFEDLEDVRVGAAYPDILQLAVEEGIVDHGDMWGPDWVSMMLARWDDPMRSPLTLRLWNNQFIRLIEQRTDGGDMVTLAVNVTDTIAREKELDEARLKAEAANRAKSAFLANMSHEIRTPMNGVLAMADLMAEGTLDDDQRLCLDTIRTSGEALLVIINDVLDYSRIEAEKLSLHPEPFDLEKSIHEVIVLLQPSAREKQIEMIVDYDMFLPTGFVGDQGRVRQVLTNLVGNAVKFTETGHVLVRVVGLRDEESGEHRVHIAVEDTGIGIAPEMQEHIFGEFNQAEDEMNRSFDGTGLGLAISRRLVALMGGDMWVESILGEGSTFGLQLSLPASSKTDEPQLGPPAWLGRVLVVDGVAANRSVLQKQLTALGIVPECHADMGQLATMDWRGEDVLFISQAGLADLDASALAGPAAVFVLCQGPAARSLDLPGNAQVLLQPVLRRELLRRLSELEPAQCPLPAEPTAPADAAPRRMRVLAAEDNKTNQLVLRKLLKSVDIDLEMVENGEEALAAYRADPPDLFFTDISMPVMDGKAATREIRAFEDEAGLERCPIVAMTAHAGPDAEGEIFAAGIDHILTKPLKRDLLVEHIEAAAPAEAELSMAAE